ncbi:MAG: hypothetical protein ABWY64_06435, partial [Tardiphaga sp.]
GADSTAAAALRAETLKNNLLQAGQYAQTIDDAMVSAAASLQNFQAGTGQSLLSAQLQAGEQWIPAPTAPSGHSQFTPTTMPSRPLTFVADPRYPISYGQGMGKNLGLGNINAQYGQSLAQVFPTDDPFHPRIVETKTEELTKSIDDLKDSTDKLNATNQELLSPYYTIDPRTSHIGFRSQGMAAGGYVDVPGGVSAQDNMLAQIPVASGEQIYVDPMPSRRGVGGGTVINISAPMMFSGPANRDEVGRTVYQTMQNAARQLQAASR